ncbi:MAG: type I methionyl aminopeptidase [bacterium]|nr:type I methionyl aminopeptidase [bacterium]
MADSKIKIMEKGGQILEKALSQTVLSIKPGQSLAQINKVFEDYVVSQKAAPGFKLVEGYHWGTCINLNHGLVHGIPHPNIKIKIGDIITIDAGVFYQGYHTDKAVTFWLTPKGPSLDHPFLKPGLKALKKALLQIKPDASLKKVSKAIHNFIDSAGFTIIPQLGGHGVGRTLHEEPMILQFVDPSHKYPPLSLYQTLAVEVIYAQGRPEFVTASDGWTLKMKDKKLSGMFEETVAVGPSGPILLTTQSLDTICLTKVLSQGA